MKSLKFFAYVWTLCAYLLFLHACASITRGPTIWPLYHHQPLFFNAEGRLSLSVDNRGTYSNFAWQGNTEKYQLISINTPIGGTIGQLCQDDAGVVLIDNKGKQLMGKDISSISQQLLGYHVPLNYLNLWINGFAAPDEPYKIQEDKLQQAGWIITRYLNKDHSPRKVILVRDNISVTVIFDHFSFSLSPLVEAPSCKR